MLLITLANRNHVIFKDLPGNNYARKILLTGMLRSCAIKILP